MYPYDYQYDGNMQYDPYTTGYRRDPQMQQQRPVCQQQTTDVVQVATVQQVEQVQMQYGQRKIIMVQNEPVIAMRVADNMGLTTTDYYRLVKFEPFTQTQQMQQPAGNYITEEQLESRLAAFADALKSQTTANSGNKNRNDNHNDNGKGDDKR